MDGVTGGHNLFEYHVGPCTRGFHTPQNITFVAAQSGNPLAVTQNQPAGGLWTLSRNVCCIGAEIDRGDQVGLREWEERSVPEEMAGSKREETG